ncbi:hypothetical protein Tco_1552190, partial [Tanacetum coccineum]
MNELHVRLNILRLTPRDSYFELEAFSDSDYGGVSLDRKSTTGGCQFLGRRLISWQCKKQTIVANSTTEAEYVAAANCCGQVLWIQNQMMDYGFNFMNTKIHIDNESTIYLLTKGFDVTRFKFLVVSIGMLNLIVSLVNTARPTLSTAWHSLVLHDGNDVWIGSIHHALIINATVDSKAVVVTEASIRSSLNFNDVDGIACLTNEAIFQNLA